MNQLNETHQEEPSKRVDIVDDVNASSPEKITKEDAERLSNGDATEDYKDLGFKDSRDSKESLARSAELQATLEKQVRGFYLSTTGKFIIILFRFIMSVIPFTYAIFVKSRHVI